MFMTETGVTSAVPGSVRNLYLVVSDSEAARAELVDRGVVVSEVFHRDGPGKAASQRPGSARRSYASYATFSDPDGNSWLLQEVTVRLPGRVDTDQRTFTSSTELASALSRAESAHGELTSSPLLMTAAACRPAPERCTRRTSWANPHRAGRSASRVGTPSEHCAGALAERGLCVARQSDDRCKGEGQ